MPRSVKSIFANGGLVLASLAIFFLAGEGAFRVWYAFKEPTFELDPERGWRTRPNLALTSAETGAVRLTTDARGFRRWGATDTDRPKVLLIGDSFTFAKDVTDKETYYARLEEALNAEFFVYGCEGYATLQELMVLEQYLDTVDPDFVLWQFCWNDFIGNHPALERNSVMNNNGMRRPYLTRGGRIVYRTPRAFGALRSFAQAHSRLLYSVLFRLDAVLGLSRVDTTSETLIRQRGQAYEPYGESVSRTRDLLERAVDLAGARPVLVFNVAHRQPYAGDLEAVCAEAGAELIPGVGESVAKAEARGEQVRAADGAHWNAAGHALCTDVLRKPLHERIKALTTSAGPDR